MSTCKDIGERSAGLFLMILFLLTPLSLLLTDEAAAEIRDRVVAFVDDQAITMSELQARLRDMAKLSPDVTPREVLNTMINRILLLREAKKYRIEAPNEDEVMKEYIDLKIRAFIRIGESDIEQFYADNRHEFTGKQFDDVREEIERYLTEKELNEKLKITLADLRKKAYIKVMLEEGRTE